MIPIPNDKRAAELNYMIRMLEKAKSDLDHVNKAVEDLRSSIVTVDESQNQVNLQQIKILCIEMLAICRFKNNHKRTLSIDDENQKVKILKTSQSSLQPPKENQASRSRGGTPPIGPDGTRNYFQSYENRTSKMNNGGESETEST